MAAGGLEWRKYGLFLRPGLQTPGLLGSPSLAESASPLLRGPVTHRGSGPGAALPVPRASPHFPGDGGLGCRGPASPPTPEEAPEVSLAGVSPNWVGRLSPWWLSPLPSGPQSEAGCPPELEAGKGWSLLTSLRSGGAQPVLEGAYWSPLCHAGPEAHLRGLSGQREVKVEARPHSSQRSLLGSAKVWKTDAETGSPMEPWGPQTPDPRTVGQCVCRGAWVEARASQVPLHKARREAVDSSVLT